jgi:DNA-binding Lrp family transcriptional regulator
MTARGGWIAIWRDITSHDVFADSDLLRLWLWLLCRAAYEPGKVPYRFGRGLRTFNVHRGELIAGRATIADALGWPDSTVRNRLKRLSELGCIEISEDKQNPLIRIVNFDNYQPVEQKGGQAKDKQKDKQSGQAKDKQSGQAKTDTEHRYLPSEIDIQDFSKDSQTSTKQDKQKNQKKDTVEEVVRKRERERGFVKIEIPKPLDTESFRDTWADYLNWIFDKDGQRLNSMTADLRLLDLSRRESQRPGKAVADLRLTIMSATTHTGIIWDSDRTSKSQNQPTQPTGRRQV